MTYITVDIDLDQVLPEFDSSDVIEYVYYNYDNSEVFNQYDYEDIRKFLIEEIGDVVIADIDTLRDLLDPTSSPYLLKEFIQEIFKKQIGE
jgi:5'(3')-deoxyribonucleotidase